MVFEIQDPPPPPQSELDWMTQTELDHLTVKNYSIYTKYLPGMLKFWSVSFDDKPFPRYKVVKNPRRCRLKFFFLPYGPMLTKTKNTTDTRVTTVALLYSSTKQS